MTPAARSALRILAIAGCGLLAALTIPDHSPTLLWKWPRPFFLQLLLSLPVIWLLVRVVADPENRPALNRGAIAGITILGGAAVVAAIVGPFPAASLEVLPLWIAPLFLFLAILWTTNGEVDGDKAAEAIAKATAAGLAGLSVISLIWWLSSDVFAAWLRAEEISIFRFIAIRNERPLGHSNYTAGVALLALGWSGCLAAMSAGRARQLWCGATAVSLLTLFSSGSRGAWIGLATLAALAVWLRMVRRGANRRRILIGVVGVAVATVALALAHPRTRALISDLRETGGLNSGDVQRYSMAQAAIRMAGERPFLGHGPGATPLIYPRHRAELAGGVETALQLHSMPLQILADTGFLGLCGALLLAALIALRLRRESQAPRLTITACAAIVFASYAIYSLTDFQLDVPIIGAAFAATAALAFRDGKVFRPPPAAIMMLAIAWLFLVVWTQRGALAERARFSGAIDALERSDFANFRDMALSGTGQLSPPLLNSTALILADPRAYGIDAPAEPATAIDLLQASLGKNPDQEIAHFNLGWLLLQTDPAAAARHFREAARLVPDKGGVYLGLSWALLAQGRTNDAVRALAVELANDPGFCVSPLWSTPAFEPARGSALVTAAVMLDGAAARGNRKASYVAALFRWLAGDDAQFAIVEQSAPAAAQALLARNTERSGEWRNAFKPSMETGRGVRRQRTAYPLVMRNADMPPPLDLWIGVEDPATARMLSPMFPAKGWLSGPQLRKLATEGSESTPEPRE